jgi:hypothetical protein
MHHHAPTQVVVDDEMVEEEPQASGELFNINSIKTEPFDLLPMINGQSFASLFDAHSNTQSDSTDEQPIVIETDRRPTLSTRRPLFEDDEELTNSPSSNHLIVSPAKKNVSI